MDPGLNRIHSVGGPFIISVWILDSDLEEFFTYTAHAHPTFPPDLSPNSDWYNKYVTNQSAPIQLY